MAEYHDGRKRALALLILRDLEDDYPFFVIYTSNASFSAFKVINHVGQFEVLFILHVY